MLIKWIYSCLWMELGNVLHWRWSWKQMLSLLLLIPGSFCCHAGVVPFVYVSGSSQRSKNRVSNRADKSIKHLLHMAALSVSQVKNSPLKKYYERSKREKIRCRFWNAVRAEIITIMFTIRRMLFFEKLSKFACVIRRIGAGGTRPNERDFNYLSVTPNIFHRCFHLYALMGSKIIVCIYGIGYTFIQLFKAIIFTVKSHPFLIVLFIRSARALCVADPHTESY